MKRLFVYVVSMIIVAAMLTACDGKPSNVSDEVSHYELNNLKGVTMIVSKSDAVSAEVIVFNDTREEYLHGEWFRIENLWQGMWYAVNLPSGVEWGEQIDIGYIAEPGGFSVHTYDWNKYYGELKPGVYRIIVSIGYPEKYLSAGFTIE